MANSVQTLPVPETLPRAWRLPALARAVLRFGRRKPLGKRGGEALHKAFGVKTIRDLATNDFVLKAQAGKIIMTDGSSQLVHALLEQDLVDQLRLMVFPVVLGSGKRVFGELNDKKPLRLVDSKTVGDGVAILTYEPVK